MAGTAEVLNELCWEYFCHDCKQLRFTPTFVRPVYCGACSSDKLTTGRPGTLDKQKLMSDEFYKKHRPTTIKGFFGNKEAKAQLGSWVKAGNVPHFMLFHGPSGCGKTTLARIMRDKLKCGPADFKELNAAGQARGIDEIKKIESQLGMAPISGETRIYLIDEAHKLTNDAQNASLKILEDVPKRVYFMFATTDPEKLLPTIRTRASTIKLVPLSHDEMSKLLNKVAMMEDVDIDEDVLEAIIEAAQGSARKGLVLLNQIAYLKPEDRLGAIEKADEKKQAIDLCRLLMNPKAKWSQVATLIKQVDVEPESFRWMMLGYAQSVCLGGGKMANRAFVILDQFSTNYFDTKRAGLVADCWEVVHGRQDE